MVRLDGLGVRVWFEGLGLSVWFEDLKGLGLKGLV